MKETELSQENIDAILKELTFRSSRSSGPGGQHINKVNTRIEVIFNIQNSKVLSPQQKTTLIDNLAGKITKEGDLILHSQKFRSQIRNKQAAIEKLVNLLENALIPEKPRIPLETPEIFKEKRLTEKRVQSQKKELRKPPEME